MGGGVISKLFVKKIHNEELESFKNSFCKNTFISLIGEGSFGQVFQTKIADVEGNITERAVKVVPLLKKGCNLSTNKEFILRVTENLLRAEPEINILQQSCHPSIVKCHAFGVLRTWPGIDAKWESNEKKEATENEYKNIPFLFIEMELCSSTLRKLLAVEERSELFYNKMSEYALCLAEALKYLHVNKKIMHRDINSSNVLIDKNGHIKLGDFGQSRIIPAEFQELTTIIGSEYYRPPEQIKRQTYTNSCDVFSLGIIFFEMFHSEIVINLNGEGNEDLVNLSKKILKQKVSGEEKIVDKMKEEISELVEVRLSIDDQEFSAMRANDNVKRCILGMFLPADRRISASDIIQQLQTPL